MAYERSKSTQPRSFTGGYLVRAVAMVFDRHLCADKTRERFSGII